MSIISLVKADASSDFKKAVERSLSLIGFRFPEGLQRIAVKPNMCLFMDYSTGQTTDPRIVAALIDCIREKASRELEISLVGSDTETRKFEHVSAYLGYKRVSREKRVELVNLSEDRSQEMEVKVAGHSFQFPLPDTIRKADLFINVPKLKLHPCVKVSCALKNIYGCIPSLAKSRYHPHLAEAIVGINKLMKPHLSLVDGVIVQGKETRRLGLMMASTDPVAIDSAAATIIGAKAERVQAVALASEEGVGRVNYSVEGEKLESFAKRFPKRSIFDEIRIKINNAVLSATKKTGFKTQ